MSTEISIPDIIARADALTGAGEDARAETLLQSALAQYTREQPDNVVGQSVLLGELGGFYRARGRYAEGEAAYLKAKALLEQLQTCVCTVDGPDASSGCSACSPRDVPFRREAEDGTQRHVEIVLGNESLTENYATTLNNLAGLYRLSGQLQKAADTFDEAIRVYESCPGAVSPESLASVYSNKGLVYLDAREPAKAIPLFLKAKEILERGGNHALALGTTISNLGFAALLERRLPDAAARFREAKALFEVAGSADMARSCADLLAQLGAGE